MSPTGSRSVTTTRRTIQPGLSAGFLLLPPLHRCSKGVLHRHHLALLHPVRTLAPHPNASVYDVLYLFAGNFIVRAPCPELKRFTERPTVKNRYPTKPDFLHGLHSLILWEQVSDDGSAVSIPQMGEIFNGTVACLKRSDDYQTELPDFVLTDQPPMGGYEPATAPCSNTTGASARNGGIMLVHFLTILDAH